MSQPVTAPDRTHLQRRLTSFGVLLLTLSCLSPALSIYGVGADVLQQAGTGAAGLFLFGIGVAAVWGFVYAELGSAYPCAGGEYVAVGSILGPWAGFASLTVWTVTAGPITAFLARTTATYVGTLLPGADSTAVTFAAMAAALGIALLAVRTSAIVTGLFLAIEMLAVLALAGAGFLHPVRHLADVLAAPQVPGPGGTLLPVPLGALAVGAVNAAYATAGGGQAIAFGEELADPHRHMGRIVVAAALIGAFATALPVIAVVVGAPDLTAVLADPAPLNAFLAATAGPALAHVVSAGVALAVFNALIAQLMFVGRLFFSLGRDGVFPERVGRLLARVHGPSGAPRIATVAVALYSAACCLVPTHLLLVFSSGLMVYSLGLVCSALLVGRRRGLTARPGYWRARLHPLTPLLGLGLALMFAVADLADADVGRPSLLVLGLAIAIGVGWCAYRLADRPGWTPHVG